MKLSVNPEKAKHGSSITFSDAEHSAVSDKPCAHLRCPSHQPGYSERLRYPTSTHRCSRAHRRHPLCLRRPDREQPEADGVVGGGSAAALSGMVRPPPLSGHEHTRITHGVPEGWERKPIAELTTFVNRGIAPHYDDDAEGLVINQKCIRNGHLDLTLVRHQAREFKPDRQVQPGDVLVNSTGEGTLGRVAQVVFPIPNCTVEHM